MGQLRNRKRNLFLLDLMEKSEQLQIYVLTHKIPPYGLPDDEYRTPIHCGKSLNDSFVCELGDNTGDNISCKNPWFVEDTGIYWVWKNDVHPYVGHFQYRRHLNIEPNKVKELVDEYGIIVPRPLNFSMSVKKHYDMCHITSDLELCESIVKEFYPEYSESWDRYINKGGVLYYSSAFITTREKYNEICEFIFSVLFEFERRIGCTTKEEWVKHGELSSSLGNPHRGEMSDAEYQSRVCGYLFERLFTLYVRHNFKCPCEVPYVLMENTNV